MARFPDVPRARLSLLSSGLLYIFLLTLQYDLNRNICMFKKYFTFYNKNAKYSKM